MLNDILRPDHIQWQPPTDQTLYRTRPFTEFWVVSIEHLRRVWHADRGRLLLRTPGPVPLGLAYALLVETNPSFSEPDYALRISLGTFSIFLSGSYRKSCYTLTYDICIYNICYRCIMRTYVLVISQKISILEQFIHISIIALQTIRLTV